MPRYFFNCEGTQNFRDEEGTELENDAAARLQAVLNSAEILRDHGGEFASYASWFVYVTDTAGRRIFAIRLTADANEAQS